MQLAQMLAEDAGIRKLSKRLAMDKLSQDKVMPDVSSTRGHRSAASAAARITAQHRAAPALDGSSTLQRTAVPASSNSHPSSMPAASSMGRHAPLHTHIPATPHGLHHQPPAPHAARSSQLPRPAAASSRRDSVRQVLRMRRLAGGQAAEEEEEEELLGLGMMSAGHAASAAGAAGSEGQEEEESEEALVLDPDADLDPEASELDAELAARAAQDHAKALTIQVGVQQGAGQCRWGVRLSPHAAFAPTARCFSHQYLARMYTAPRSCLSHWQ